jgi:hypothetical protein
MCVNQQRWEARDGAQGCRHARQVLYPELYPSLLLHYQKYPGLEEPFCVPSSGPLSMLLTKGDRESVFPSLLQSPNFHKQGTFVKNL